MGRSRKPDEMESARELTEQLGLVVARIAAAADSITGETIMQLGSRAIPQAEHSALTLLQADRAPVTIAASGGLPRQVDALQYRFREGPCLDAATGTAVRLADDVAADPRWPNFGPRCTQATGVRSMLSLRLPVQGQDRAAINFYSTTTKAFGEADISAASVIVPLAAIVVEAGLREMEHHHLIAALESSRHISTAEGIVMATQRITSAVAFNLLRRASMDLNEKLSDVADQFNRTGSLDHVPGSARN